MPRPTAISQPQLWRKRHQAKATSEASEEFASGVVDDFLGARVDDFCLPVALSSFTAYSAF